MPEQLRPESKDLGEAATTTLNPNLKKSCQAKPLDKSIFLLYNNIRCGDELCLLKTS